MRSTPPVTTRYFPPFDAFPYLVTKLGPGTFHYNLLPEGELVALPLLEITMRQYRASRLPLCLVLSRELAVYFDDDGTPRCSSHIPGGGAVVSGRLHLPKVRLFIRKERKARLAAYLERYGPETVFGDLSKGGRPATAKEKKRLAGTRANGVPKGLTQCSTCHEWRGEALDPGTEFAGQMMQVHCVCDNHNRCARCGKHLAHHRLNANYFRETDGQIWHTPGFLALRHRCGRRNWTSSRKEEVCLMESPAGR